MGSRARLKRVDPLLINLFEEVREKGEVASFPEFTRMIARQVKQDEEKSRQVFKFI
jgi:O-succinylbenzoate synthase